MNSQTIERAKQLKSWLKTPYAFPGGYEIACYVGGSRICKDCLLSEWSWIIQDTSEICIGIYWEGPNDFCDCGQEFESTYGDPEEETE